MTCENVRNSIKRKSWLFITKQWSKASFATRFCHSGSPLWSVSGWGLPLPQPQCNSTCGRSKSISKETEKQYPKSWVRREGRTHWREAEEQAGSLLSSPGCCKSSRASILLWAVRAVASRRPEEQSPVFPPQVLSVVHQTIRPGSGSNVTPWLELDLVFFNAS